MAPLTAPDPYGLVASSVRGLKIWDGWFRIAELSLEPASADPPPSQ